MTEVVREFGPVKVVLGEKSGKYPDGNQVIVQGRDTKAVFDMPLVANRIPRELEGTDLVVLGHMHEDHAAGLHLLPRAKVFAHSADLAAVQSWEGLSKHYGYGPEVLTAMRAKIEKEFHYTPRPDAVGYEHGQTWDLGGSTVKAWHMPGHTAGHCVLTVEPEGVAFIGDIDLSSFGPYYGDGCSSLAAFRRTLDTVADIPARVWVTSHHKGVITDREEFLWLLAAFKERIRRREEAILAELAKGPRTLEDLVAHRFVYPPGLDILWVDNVERFTIRQHLNEWTAEGRVLLEEGRYRVARAA